MMLVSKKELCNLKLRSIKAEDLRTLALDNDISSAGNCGDLIKRLIDLPTAKIDFFIKQRYANLISDRQAIISDSDLMEELKKVSSISWGVVQGQLDQKIQSEYVRKFFRFNDLVSNVNKNLHKDILSYVTATWYNHWSTVLIEDHISSHKYIIPTLKHNFGVDVFFDNQPFDLKTTYLPRGYNIEDALDNPKKLAIWMYENQGAQRFGSDNRLFVILLDKNKPEESWRLKRDFEFIFEKIDRFFDESSVTKDDEIIFNYQGRTYTTIAKTLIISK